MAGEEAVVAGQIGATPAQVAVAWTLLNSAVTAPIIGARTPAQFDDNLGALDIKFDDTHLTMLDQCGAVGLGFPHEFLTRPMVRNVIFGDTTIEPRHCP